MFLLRLNRWYDRLQEPGRFMLAMGLIVPLVLMVGLDSLACKIVGTIGVLSLVGFRITAKWIEKRLDKK